MSHMKMQTMLVTPEMAKKWLDQCNIGNRKLRPSHVNALAGMIARGEWKLTHQGIAFSVCGKLVDGQHRLKAVVVADKPVLMNVAFDVPDDAFIALDQGVTRNTADILSIDTRISEPLRYASQIYFGTTRPSPQQVKDLGEKGLLDILEMLVQKSGATRKTFSSAPFKLAAALKIMSADSNQEIQYILDQYRALTVCDIDKMSQTSKAAMKRATQNRVDTTNKGEMLALGMIVFDARRRNLLKLRIDIESPRIAYEAARKIMASKRPMVARIRDPHGVRYESTKLQAAL